MGFFSRVSKGLSNSRAKFTEQMNVLLDRGPDVDDEFWEGLEEALILSDVGAPAASEIIENMQDEARRHALPDAYAVMDALTERIADTFVSTDTPIFDGTPRLVLFVGINGSGKTTTVGKLAAESHAAGRNVLLGSADTFRAAAIEQLEEWARRAQVEIVTRERGSDPASVCYDTIERAEAVGADFVLIDTAGRLHTSDDLMRELQKVVNVVRKRSRLPVSTVLVIDATTGQNGLNQAREFNRALNLDGLIVTKLDGTAKGGIALAISHELELPIEKIGVGESIEDLRDFDPYEFAAALIGAEEVDSEGNFIEQDEDEGVQGLHDASSFGMDEPSTADWDNTASEEDKQRSFAFDGQARPVTPFESRPAPEPEPQPQPESEPKHEPSPQPEPRPEPQPEPEPEPRPEPVFEPKHAAMPAVEPEYTPAPTFEPKHASMPASVSEPEPEPDSASSFEPSFESKHAYMPESASEFKPEPQPEPEPEPGFAPESEEEPKKKYRFRFWKRG